VITRARLAWIAFVPIGLAAALWSTPVGAASQELEPRLLSNVPVGTNFLLGAYAFSKGNILLDPAVPIEGLDAELHTVVGAYVRSFSLLGLSSKVDLVVPIASGDWVGRVEGRDSSRAVTGLGDPRVRLSVAFAGAPALTREEFRGFTQETVAGVSVQVIAPLGQYDPARLINLGSNRWTIRTQLGLSHTVGNWIYEGYAAAWIFTANDNFWGGNLLEQKPLATAKAHVIRTFGQRRWLAGDAGFGFGGRSILNGDERDTRLSTFRLGLTLAWPISQRHTLKLVAASAFRIEKGPDFDVFGGTWQYMR
jgi:hypothetical protein